jgi:hypothetical protein
MRPKPTLDELRRMSAQEQAAVMRSGVIAALRWHKEAGVPAVVWDEKTGEVRMVPPDQIPDFPDEPGDDNVTE